MNEVVLEAAQVGLPPSPGHRATGGAEVVLRWKDADPSTGATRFREHLPDRSAKQFRKSQ